MSGTTTELGNQPVVASADIPTTKIPALNAAGTVVLFTGDTLVAAVVAEVPPGSTWSVVTAVPDASVGNIGDMAYLPASGSVYQKQNITTGSTTEAEWVLVGNIQGDAGTNGSSILSVQGVPSDAVGSVGDQAVDSTTGNLWLKGENGWTLEGSLVGPPGAAGATPVFQSGTTETLPAGSSAVLTIDASNPMQPIVNASLPQGPQGVPGTPGVDATAGTVKGAYNAATNTPTLSAAGGGGSVGDIYTVSVAGTPSFDSLGALTVGQQIQCANVSAGVNQWQVRPTLAEGGTFTAVSAASVSLTGGGSLTTSSYALPYVWNDQNLFTAGYIASDGTLTFSRANISSFTASIGTFGGATYSAGGGYAFQVSDANGYVGAAITAQGGVIAQSVQAQTASVASFSAPFTAPPNTSIAGLSFSASTSFDYAIADPNGYVIFYQANGVAASAASGSGSTQPSTTQYSSTEIAARNNRNLALSANVVGQIDSTSARPVWNYSHILIYGQSLSTGQEGWPALNTAQPYDNLMYGGSVRPVAYQATVFTPEGGAALNPLISVNQTNDSAGTILTPSQVAALAPGDATLGENSGVSAVNFFRKLQLQQRGLLSDPDRLLVASSCGVGGQSVEQLSKGASPELFNRLRSCATGVKSLATAVGKSYGVAAIIYMQGEYNNGPVGGTGPTGGTTDGPTFQALTQQLYADIVADIATTIASQAQPPAIFTYQTNEISTVDSLAIPQAQLNSALTQTGWYMAGPIYPVTDKAQHLDANGYRWFGQQLAKVMHKVLTLGQKWLPVYPTGITFRGQYVLVDFHVPEPPLVFDVPWVGSDSGSGTLGPATLTNNGFTVYDDAGVVPIASMAIASDTSVLITLGRTLSTNPMLRFADHTYNNGNGGLRDSDPTIADEDYLYTAGSGQYAAANITSLVNKPYPLWNWCVAFNMPIVAG